MRLPVIVSSLSVLAACAPSAGAPAAEGGSAASGRRCFYADQVQNFRAPDDHTLYVRSLNNDVFEFSVAACRDISFANAIAFQPRAGASTLCPGDSAFLHVPGGTGIGAMPCRAQVVRKLTPEDVAALPDRDRP